MKYHLDDYLYNMKRDYNVRIINSYLGEDTQYPNMRIVEFLYGALGKYGDTMDDIYRAVNYVFKRNGGYGGFILLAIANETIVGAVVVNETGMEGYIPENILVYIAVSPSRRGEGIGYHLMQEALKLAKGDVALHVEAENPARKLYEQVGFEAPYVEMRYKRARRT